MHIHCRELLRWHEIVWEWKMRWQPILKWLLLKCVKNRRLSAKYCKKQNEKIAWIKRHPQKKITSKVGSKHLLWKITLTCSNQVFNINPYLNFFWKRIFFRIMCSMFHKISKHIRMTSIVQSRCWLELRLAYKFLNYW